MMASNWSSVALSYALADALTARHAVQTDETRRDEESQPRRRNERPLYLGSGRCGRTRSNVGTGR